MLFTAFLTSALLVIPVSPAAQTSAAPSSGGHLNLHDIMPVALAAPGLLKQKLEGK